jgi:hypothetical protein
MSMTAQEATLGPTADEARRNLVFDGRRGGNSQQQADQT